MRQQYQTQRYGARSFQETPAETTSWTDKIKGWIDKIKEYWWVLALIIVAFIVLKLKR